MPTESRAVDIVLLGATGFTGGLIAEYLAANAPSAVTMAVAGRSPAKLDDVVARTGGRFEPIVVDATDRAGLRAMTARCRVLITTVGPYILHGDAVVAACADTGTDYLDLTGGPEFTVDQLPEDVPLSVRGYVRMKGTLSGGTAASALEIMGRMRQGRTIHDIRLQVEPELVDRTVTVATGKVGRDAATGWWVVPMPTIDPLIVAESARLLPRYGPDFTYAHFMATEGPLATAATIGGIGALLTAAQFPPARRALARLRPSGTGPTTAQREQAWFRVRFVGDGGGARVVTEVAGGDPGYTETSKMIGEAALCLALDDLPTSVGQVTTASAMGPALRTRLEAAGITFTVLH